MIMPDEPLNGGVSDDVAPDDVAEVEAELEDLQAADEEVALEEVETDDQGDDAPPVAPDPGADDEAFLKSFEEPEAGKPAFPTSADAPKYDTYDINRDSEWGKAWGAATELSARVTALEAKAKAAADDGDTTTEAIVRSKLTDLIEQRDAATKFAEAAWPEAEKRHERKLAYNAVIEHVEKTVPNVVSAVIEDVPAIKAVPRGAEALRYMIASGDSRRLGFFAEDKTPKDRLRILLLYGRDKGMIRPGDSGKKDAPLGIGQSRRAAPAGNAPPANVAPPAQPSTARAWKDPETGKAEKVPSVYTPAQYAMLRTQRGWSAEKIARNIERDGPVRFPSAPPAKKK